MKKLTMRLFVLGLLIGTVGQIIWSIIFWNNLELFMYHWGVGLVGLSLVIVGICIFIWP